MIRFRGADQAKWDVDRQAAAAFFPQPGVNGKRVVDDGVELAKVVAWRSLPVGDEATPQYACAPLLHLRLAEVEIEREITHDEAPADSALERVEARLQQAVGDWLTP